MTDRPLHEVVADMACRMSPGPWTVCDRDDKDSPSSIAFDVKVGRAHAVAMCPRYGLTRWRKDADALCAIRNALPQLAAVLKAADALRSMSGESWAASKPERDAYDAAVADLRRVLEGGK